MSSAIFSRCVVSSSNPFSNVATGLPSPASIPNNFSTSSSCALSVTGDPSPVTTVPTCLTLVPYVSTVQLTISSAWEERACVTRRKRSSRSSQFRKTRVELAPGVVLTPTTGSVLVTFSRARLLDNTRLSLMMFFESCRIIALELFSLARLLASEDLSSSWSWNSEDPKAASPSSPSRKEDRKAVYTTITERVQRTRRSNGMNANEMVWTGIHTRQEMTTSLGTSFLQVWMISSGFLRSMMPSEVKNTKFHQGE
mmetsp:Transcript_22381/g.31129  ORF Transcript_22381/g.31129 Transcript_22381/m.31129 type:complete len:254 (-) Transcript_22381:848-1609(-)